MQGLSHLNALRAVEATARLGGNAAAAREIGVTAEAVGQLVRGYEDYIGARIFKRGAGRGLAPTAAAAPILAVLARALSGLADAHARFRRLDRGDTLAVTAPPSLAAAWLAPRLPAFLAAHPEAHVRLDITSDVRDLAAGEADVAIRYLAGEAGVGEERVLIAEEALVPVCSPAFRKAHGPFARAEDLASVALIRDATVAVTDHPNWREWFAAFAPAAARTGATIEFNAALLAVQAARLGQGAALIRRALVAEDLRTGALVRVFEDRDLPTGRRYVLVLAPQASPRARAFADWFEGALRGAVD